MNGIYLNDIPMDLFLKYFTKDDLKDTKLEPVLENYTSKIDTFTITKGGQEYYFKTSLTVNIDDDDVAIEVIKKDIEYSFNDIFTFSTVLTLPYEHSRTTSTSTDNFSYVNSVTKQIYPYKYRLTTSENINYNFIEIIDSGNAVIDLASVTSSLTVSIRDMRTLQNLFNGVTIDSTYNVISSNVIIAKIYVNENFKINKKDNQGKKLFLDKFDNQTTEPYAYSKFVRHNGMIRAGFNGLIDHRNLLLTHFNPSMVGWVQDGINDKFQYYETFSKSVSYTILAQDFPAYQLDTIDENLWNEVNAISGKIKINSEDLVFYKEILNISDLPVIKAAKALPSGNDLLFKSLSAYTRIDAKINSPVLVEEYTQKASVRGTEYTISYGPNNNHIVYKNQVTNIITDNTEVFIRIPVEEKIINGIKSYFVLLEENGSLKEYIAEDIGSGYQYKLVIDKQNYIIDKSVQSFRYGSIKIPVTLIPSDKYQNRYIGTLQSILANGDARVSKYSPIVSRIEIPEVIDISAYTLTNGSYVKTVIKRDILDRSKVMEIKETISLINNAYSYIFTEMFDYNHEFTQGDELFTTRLTKKKVTRNTAITGPVKLDNLKSDMSKFGQFVANSYLSKRGSYIDGDIISNLKRSIFNQMISEFLKKQYRSNFFITNNLSYSNEGTFKMRAFAEGIMYILASDRTDYGSFTKRKRILKYNDLNLKVIAEKTESLQDTNQIIGKDYDKNMGLGYALNEIKDINAFEKLYDYKNFATDQEREDYLKKEFVRAFAYQDKNESVLISNDPDNPKFLPKKNMIFKSEFKNAIVNLMSGYFAEFNDTVDNNKYKEDYRINYKTKLDNLPADPILMPELDISEKRVYSGYYASVGQENYEKDLIETIFSKDENWGVR